MCSNRVLENRLGRLAHQEMISVIEASRFDLQASKANGKIHRVPTFFNVKRMTRKEAGPFPAVILANTTGERPQERSLFFSVSNLGFTQNDEAVKHLLIVHILVVREIAPVE